MSVTLTTEYHVTWLHMTMGELYNVGYNDTYERQKSFTKSHTKFIQVPKLS